MLTLFTKTACPRCEQLKKTLEQMRVIHEVVNLDDDASLQAFKLAYPHVKSVPFLAGNSLLFR